MRYPAFRCNSAPTPNNYLIVCDKCQKAEWAFFTVGRIFHCFCGDRYRQGTVDEREAANDALEKGIAQNESKQ